MYHSEKFYRAARRWTALCLLLVVASGSNCPSGNGLAPGLDSGLATNVEAGADFDSAALLTIPDNDTLSFTGSVDGTGPDVFDLGPVAPGDRLVVEVSASAGSTLDPVIAIFDEDKSLFSISDDIDTSGGNFNSAINDVVTVASNSFFLAISKFFLDNSGGAYGASIRIERSGPLPNPPTQTLLLNFAGGPATIENEGSFDLDPFDAADVDASYSGKTAVVKQAIVDTVNENFAAYGIVIVSSDDNPNLTPGTFSTIHFGAFSATKFGVADSVDVGNLDYCDDGIIFTNGFDNPFAVKPSPEGIGVAIGNVAAHEAGHLLGLNHVADITALMDNTGTASTLLADQNFKVAPLSPSVFPIGNQDAPALLNRVIPP